MSYGAEAADQVVRITLNGVEVAARITGKAAERLAALIYSIIKDNRRTKGKGRLNNMLKSGKELAIFTIKDRNMPKFMSEAKRYGILYCVLKDRKANDGVTDIMVRETDSSKVNRIFTRYGLYDFSKASIRTEVVKSREEAEAQRAGERKIQEDEKAAEAEKEPEAGRPPVSERERIDAYFQDVLADENPERKEDLENPMPESRPSGRSSGTRTTGLSIPERADEERDRRPSVKKELEKIRSEESSAKKPTPVQAHTQSQPHQTPKKKKPRKGR